MESNKMNAGRPEMRNQQIDDEEEGEGEHLTLWTSDMKLTSFG